ncbi:NUDIX hydrolase (plasmid) [Novosphingobium sp. BL-8A]|uniref:NUDIX hydrolase n=1 Tax=Novosphingobium sp. BL-8A TaxID=3127639 RepID=UPI003756F36C
MKNAQFAAIPYRRNGKHDLEVLLVTSRRKGRWVLPKGTVRGMLPHACAAREALEEAGVLGDIRQAAFGTYVRLKRAKASQPEAIPVFAFPLLVRTQLEIWPEMSFRRRRWLSSREAVDTVEDSGLADILGRFAAAYALEDPGI